MEKPIYKKLAFRGNPEKSGKIINLLKNFGGIALPNFTADDPCLIYYKNELNEITAGLYKVPEMGIDYSPFAKKEFIIYEYDEFKEYFPLETGDRANYIKNGVIQTKITQMIWYCNTVFYNASSLDQPQASIHFTPVKNTAKNVRFMTFKEKLMRFRNLTKGLLIRQKNSIQNNILFNLPERCKSLSDDEMEIIRRIKADYNALIATWDYRSQQLLNQIDNNI